MVSRREILKLAGAGAIGWGASGLLPSWAQSASAGNRGIFETAGNDFDLTVDRTPVAIGGRAGRAITVNGTLPGPLLRFREGEQLTLRVRNMLSEDTSVHWHGCLVPFHMDGVPGITFPGIAPGETFVYRFALPQNGTYWYHSHSGLQLQAGHFGPIIIDPAGPDPVSSDREYVLVLSDWTFENPHKLFADLKKQSGMFNFQRRTVVDFIKDARVRGLGRTIADRAMWGRMRMSATDIADVTGSVYTYLINGHATADNWTAVFKVGERVRLRIINASAMTIFNFRIPGLPMTVVQNDGQYVRPVETDEFQIGVAETYDVIVEPKSPAVFPVVAESIDRSGEVVATFAPEAGMRAAAPPLRERPLLTMEDMGMGGMGMPGMDMSGMDMSGMNMPGMQMDHSPPKAGMKQRGSAMPAKDSDNNQMRSGAGKSVRTGVGVDNVVMTPTSRLNDPGLGLENVGHRTLSYSQLRSLAPNPDLRAPEREIEVHLTGNMERYMWSFDGVKFSDAKEPIIFHEGERVRVTLINDTMMTHPIHLHGMFFDLVVDESDYKPRKHTVDVKPAERVSFDVTADHIGDWAFHCHLLYHMHAGMMRVVSILPRGRAA